MMAQSLKDSKNDCIYDFKSMFEIMSVYLELGNC